MQVLHRTNPRILPHRLAKISREVPHLPRIRPHRMLRRPALIREHRQKLIRQLPKSSYRLTHRSPPQPVASLADDASGAPASTAPAPHAYKPVLSQYPHVPAKSAHSSDPLHAPPYASRSYAAAYADSPHYS